VFMRSHSVRGKESEWEWESESETDSACQRPLSRVELIDATEWVEFRETLSEWGIGVTKKMSAGKGALLQS